mmetsp:Transcript_82281/g.172295  ORF Transcript_82281/g.172295 Transcript_82281/m.172295 type:complete len:368 (-) Transcript_82281:103-1206(-)
MGRRRLAAEVFLGHSVHEARLLGAQLLHEDALGIGALDAVHGIVDEREVLARNELLDCLEVEALAQELDMIVGAVEDVHSDAFHQVAARRLDINVGEAAADLVFRDGLGAGEDGFGDLLWRRAAVLAIELDAEILVQAARVVRGREDEATEGHEASLSVSDHGACGGGAEQTVLADPDGLDTVRHCHLDDGLDCGGVVVSAVSGNNEGAALDLDAIFLQGVEGALNEVVEIVLLHEDLGLLSEAGGAGLLALEGLRGLGGDGGAAGELRHGSLALEDDGDVWGSLGWAQDRDKLSFHGHDDGNLLLLQSAGGLDSGVDSIAQGGQDDGVDGCLGRLSVLLWQAFQEGPDSAGIEGGGLLRRKFDLDG